MSEVRSSLNIGGLRRRCCTLLLYMIRQGSDRRSPYQPRGARDAAMHNPPGNWSALSRDRTGTLPECEALSNDRWHARPSAFNLERATTTIDSRTWPIEPQVSALSMAPWPDRR
jgi:hypothetical protein